MDILNDIISGLKWGNLDPIDAHDRLLLLFNKQLPLDFVKWYSGMEEEKILKAYERWKNESRNVKS